MTTGSLHGKNSMEAEKEDCYMKNRNRLMTYIYMALMAMVVSVILIMLRLYLAAGVLILVTALFFTYLVRKGLNLMDSVRNSLSDASTSSVKKDDVINDFSHRIREPLNNLVIITDMLFQSGLQKKQKDLLDTFVASTKNMVTTVNELTMLSAKNLAFETRKHIRFNLPDTIENTIELYSLKDKANLSFTLNRKEFSNFECLGDPVILKQILLDLFNTIESQSSVRSTKVTITLNREKDSDTESYMGLKIQTDSRMLLIDEENTAHSLAARLISAVKGSFSQESGSDNTVLNIVLPFTKVPEPKQDTASSAINELIQKGKTRKELRNIRILLVEDNLINQKITLLTLKPLVRSIDTASNGREALDKFGTSAYDLILMDIQMPVMSGLEATEKIRALEADTNTHIPIIAITANAMIGDKEKCLSAGIDEYISKPFQPSVLVEKIKKLI